MSSNVPYLGCKISLISKSEIRYEGILYTIDPRESTVALAKVKSFGTEDRPTDRPVAPREEVYEYIIFRGSDIKDIRVCEPPKPQPTLAGGLPSDPAIVQHSTPPGLMGAGSTRLVNNVPISNWREAGNLMEVLSQSRDVPQTSSQAIVMQQGHSHVDQGVQVGPQGVRRKRNQAQGGNRSNVTHPTAEGGQGSGNNAENFRERNGQQMNRGQNQSGRSGRGRGGSRQGLRGSRGGAANNRPSHRLQQHQGPDPLNFDGDFDFDKGNTEFEELRSQLNQTESKKDDLPVIDETSENWDPNAKEWEEIPEKEEKKEEERKDDSGHGSPESEDKIISTVEKAVQPEIPPCKAFYDKAKSFFDSISCEAIEKTKGKMFRINWREEQKLNVETFGEQAVHHSTFMGNYRSMERNIFYTGFRGYGYPMWRGMRFNRGRGMRRPMMPRGRGGWIPTGRIPAPRVATGRFPTANK